MCGDVRRLHEDEYNGRASTTTPRWPWRKWKRERATTLRPFFVLREEKKGKGRRESEREGGRESGVDG